MYVRVYVCVYVCWYAFVFLFTYRYVQAKSVHTSQSDGGDCACVSFSLALFVSLVGGCRSVCVAGEVGDNIYIFGQYTFFPPIQLTYVVSL